MKDELTAATENKQTVRAMAMAKAMGRWWTMQRGLGLSYAAEVRREELHKG